MHSYTHMLHMHTCMQCNAQRFFFCWHLCVVCAATTWFLLHLLRFPSHICTCVAIFSCRTGCRMNDALDVAFYPFVPCRSATSCDDRFVFFFVSPIAMLKSCSRMRMGRKRRPANTESARYTFCNFRCNLFWELARQHLATMMQRDRVAHTYIHIHTMCNARRFMQPIH